MRRHTRSFLRRAGAAVAPVLILLSLVSAAPAQERPAPADAILGVRIGMPLDEARALLDRLGTGTGRDTRGGGRKEVWALSGTDFQYVSLKADGRRRVVWVSGFARPDRAIPFERLGDVAGAAEASGSVAIWNVAAGPTPYRLVAKGRDGRAAVVYLLDLTAPPVE
jgi:hypothetical protein